ncbi:unnamed protein product [Toxocara canis]|uniref:ULP_PROTEASE domain-containing protein n=1 Tax=Toxocara canis TaxID=6265 RepID=A0A183VGV1_TOXCA|nr:unnamed protein product [Toxocara canis]
MPRLKRKSVEQRNRERKNASKLKKDCLKANATLIENDNTKNDTSGASLSNIVSSVKKGNRLKVKGKTNDSNGVEYSGRLNDEQTEELVINTSNTPQPLCDSLKKITLNELHSPTVPVNERLPDVIGDHLQLVHAIIDSDLGEASLRDLLNPAGWLDAQTIYAYLESVAANSTISVIIVQPFIWMSRIVNGESIAPYRYVRHYIRNYTDDWELLLVPIVLPGHHVLGAYRKSTRIFQYYDSLRNPMSEETRAAVTDMLHVLHPGVEHIFVNSTEVVHQHDGSSCGVIACYTAYQLMAGRPTCDIAFDISRFRQVIYNKITTRRAERDRSALADSTRTRGIPETNTTGSGLVDSGCAKVTPSSMSRARAAKRRGGSVDGSETPKCKPGRKCARKIVTTGNGMYMRFHEIFQNAVHARDQEGRTDEPFIRMRIVNVSEAAAADKAGIHPGRLNAPTSGQVMAVFDADDDGAPPDPRSRGTWVYPRKSRSPRPLPHWSPDACPLLFPMLLPYGQRFYEMGIRVAKATNAQSKAKRKETTEEHTMKEDEASFDHDIETTTNVERKQRSFISHRDFALYHYAYRASDKPHWLWAARGLAQQFVYIWDRFLYDNV